VPKELLPGDSHVLDDLAQERWRDIPAAVDRYGRGTAVLVPKLLVRPALANFDKVQSLKNRDDFPRAEDGKLSHRQVEMV
jgi:hypothetical protein